MPATDLCENQDECANVPIPVARRHPWFRSPFLFFLSFFRLGLLFLLPQRPEN
eukprot:m.493735 g.493735  ORF g.493735 m.493735 type:complete len:53 (-) comp38052_c0_seq1:30-188(-)